ncbi:MAG: M24 family metallopeptidase, partial [Desulfobacteraceae bacterium]|nr:M24 family metallopeptidase [Desulfobacteraceae bacterium]
MAKQNIQALLLTHKPDIFYFSGTAQDCYLLIDCEKEPMLFVKRYLPRAKKESFLKTILPIASIRDIPERIKDFHHHWPKNLGLAFDVVPVKDYLFFQRLLDGCGLTDGTAVIDFCRKIKSDWELQQIKQAAAISKQTFEFAQTHLECGMTEMEFCGIIEAFARKQGHSGKAQSRHYRAQIYPFHLVSGKNGGMPGALDSPFSGTGVSTIFPFGPGPKKIKKNE